MDKLIKGRREALKYLAGVSLLGLGGCCCRTTRPISQIPDVDAVISGPSQFLKPTFNKEKVSGDYVIDVHGHFFNASDVNVKGYLQGPVARTMGDGVLYKLTRALAGVVDFLARNIALHASEEYKYLTGLDEDEDFKKFESRQKREYLYKEISKHRDMLATQLYNEMKNQGVDKIFIDAKNEFYNAVGFKVIEYKDFSISLILQSIDPDQRKAEYKKLKTEKQLSAMKLDPAGILEFVGHMLSPRWGSFIDYQRAYSENNGSFGVDAVFASLVDFDYWLECIPPSSRLDQVKLLSLMSKMSGGYMLPLVSYNPWTDIKHKDASFDLVKKAIDEYGFIGVKIYPANGFYPYGNEKNNIETSQARPDLALLDEKLFQLFEWCAKNSIPVLAHTGESMGSDDNADTFGGPLGWKELFNKFKDSEHVPIVSAGHFGGDHYTVNGHLNRWSTEFGELMKLQSGSLFYGDLGYWSALKNCDGDCEAKQRIQNSIKASNKLAKSRIMYGSDWLMLSQEPGWSDFPFKIKNLINDVLPIKQFFYINAMKCFGLTKNGKQRKKIEGVFNDKLGGLPAWLKI